LLTEGNFQRPAFRIETTRETLLPLASSQRKLHCRESEVVDTGRQHLPAIFLGLGLSQFFSQHLQSYLAAQSALKLAPEKQTAGQSKFRIAQLADSHPNHEADNQNDGPVEPPRVRMGQQQRERRGR